jgi:hypothetical protein
MDAPASDTTGETPVVALSSTSVVAVDVIDSPTNESVQITATNISAPENKNKPERATTSIKAAAVTQPEVFVEKMASFDPRMLKIAGDMVATHASHTRGDVMRLIKVLAEAESSHASVDVRNFIQDHCFAPSTAACSAMQALEASVVGFVSNADTGYGVLQEAMGRLAQESNEGLEDVFRYIDVFGGEEEGRHARLKMKQETALLSAASAGVVFQKLGPFLQRASLQVSAIQDQARAAYARKEHEHLRQAVHASSCAGTQPHIGATTVGAGASGFAVPTSTYPGAPGPYGGAAEPMVSGAYPQSPITGFGQAQAQPVAEGTTGAPPVPTVAPGVGAIAAAAPPRMASLLYDSPGMQPSIGRRPTWDDILKGGPSFSANTMGSRNPSLPSGANAAPFGLTGALCHTPIQSMISTNPGIRNLLARAPVVDASALAMEVENQHLRTELERIRAASLYAQQAQMPAPGHHAVSSAAAAHMYQTPGIVHPLAPGVNGGFEHASPHQMQHMQHMQPMQPMQPMQQAQQMQQMQQMPQAQQMQQMQQMQQVRPPVGPSDHEIAHSLFNQTPSGGKRSFFDATESNAQGPAHVPMHFSASATKRQKHVSFDEGLPVATSRMAQLVSNYTAPVAAGYEIRDDDDVNQ